MTKQLKLRWVTDAIGDDYKKWRRGDVVRIESQTGTGKTVLVTGSVDGKIKGIVDRMEDYENLIYICNRLELKRQIKLDLLKKWGIELPKTNEELDEITKIRNVVITSYHAIAFSELGNIYSEYCNNMDDYDYIICDECHYFLTDSSFNNKTYLSYNNLILKHHRNAIKIFISATMDEIAKVIEKGFMLNLECAFGTSKNSSIYTYSTDKDYSYLDVKYYKNIKSIEQLIKNDKSEAKWIIFVSSKSKGKAVEKQLNEYKVNCTFVYAGMSNDEKKMITNDSKFKSKVLITTKALDNGINIKDRSVKNIVVESWDKTTFIQEIGRVRFKINDAPTINLFIPTMSLKSFKTKIDKYYKPKEDDLELFNKNYNEFCKKYDNDSSKVHNDIFYLSSDEAHKWTINLLGRARLYNDSNFASNMIDNFKKDKQFAYVMEQLRWLGLEHTFSPLNLIIDVVDCSEIETLEEFLNTMINKRLYDEEQQLLSNLIIKELTTISKGIDYRTKKLKPSTVEAILREQLELPYVVSKSKKEDRIINGKRSLKNYIIISKI